MEVKADGRFIVFSMNGVEVYDPRMEQFEDIDFCRHMQRKTWYTSHVAMQTERVLLANGVKIAKA